MNKVFSDGVSLLLSSIVCFFPHPLLGLHIDATFSSQLFYFMTVAKIHSNSEEPSGVQEQLTAAWQNTVFIMKICTFDV